MTQVGMMAPIPASPMAANSNASIYAKNSIRLLQSTTQGAKLIPRLLLGELPIRMEIETKVKIAIPFLLGVGAEQTVRKKCGMMLAGVADRILHANVGSLGPLVCADSFAHLTIPPATESTSEGVDLVGVDLASHEIELATVLKNV